MRQQGFGLIELLMGLTITGIVLHLVSPMFGEMIASSRREQAARSLASGINSARSEAIARNQNVMVHGINGDWGQGWRIILDVSGQGHDDSDNPLLIERRSGTRLPVFGNLYVRTSIRFSPLGEPVGGGFQSGTLHVCATREALSQYQVVLASSGRVSLRNDRVAQALCEGGSNQRADA
ncbi:GspH/FimT family pseudopilin [Pseudomonas vancouverensis]|uniref:Type II secretion system protein H n=1 Tax=Pseudomonas vancouverensis TaxID=95300 RepID=A0A1H2PHR1_PSEVA|nr:GspH/FimT family pseudopilin [Pseudomonas vancouverensis]KAB0492581.1 prepilin-type N-terminal cleavage/methylation domain-containing protein [Pseudomonas vancouverensis]TDB58469.1 prepilin-type N-terminal cleavage/methylation domain-containing protein [Pseudomonas vancouverensis]SDV17267.1 type IV fimbrial biogenesis protein FimT [Pseudomonas vancouverensis]